MAVAEKIQRNSASSDFDVTVARLAAKPSARAVIMFVDEDNIRSVGFRELGSPHRPPPQQSFIAEESNVDA